MTPQEMLEFNRRSTARAVGYGTGVWDDHCPRGCDISAESTDRRVLWSLQNALAVAGSVVGDVHDRLIAYLRITCPHHWHWQGPDPDFAHLWQCLWCNVVETEQERAGL